MKSKEEVEKEVKKMIKDVSKYPPYNKNKEELTWAENYIRRKLYLINGITEEEETNNERPNL